MSVPLSVWLSLFLKIELGNNYFSLGLLSTAVILRQKLQTAASQMIYLFLKLHFSVVYVLLVGLLFPLDMYFRSKNNHLPTQVENVKNTNCFLREKWKLLSSRVR